MDREVKNVNDALISEKERAEGQEAAIRTEFANADSKLKSDLTTALSEETKRASDEEAAIRQELEDRFNYAAKHTELPEKADMQKIEDFVYSVNEKIIRGEIK